MRICDWVNSPSYWRLSQYRSWTTRSARGRVQRGSVTLCTLLMFQEYSIKNCVNRIAKRPGEIFGLAFRCLIWQPRRQAPCRWRREQVFFESPIRICTCFNQLALGKCYNLSVDQPLITTRRSQRTTSITKRGLPEFTGMGF